MYNFSGYSTTELGNKIYRALADHGIKEDSRNGPVLRFDAPVSITYLKPWRRCNFTIGRDANPIFHHMEAIWMLAGRRDVGFPNIFNSNLKNYSDDGKTFNAAYGHRMRNHFDTDQLLGVCKHLIKNPTSRQAVIQLWDPADLNMETKDKACNLSMVFGIDNTNTLNMIIFNRSNDAIWGGVTGTNPVHFSYIMQYVVWELHKHHGTKWGKMTVVSNNLHVYTELYPHWGQIIRSPTKYPFLNLDVPGIGSLTDLEEFCDVALHLRPIIEYSWQSPLLDSTTIPMFNYWVSRKFHDDYSASQFWLHEIQEPDWELVVELWDEAHKINPTHIKPD